MNENYVRELKNELLIALGKWASEDITDIPDCGNIEITKKQCASVVNRHKERIVEVERIICRYIGKERRNNE